MIKNKKVLIIFLIIAIVLATGILMHKDKKTPYINLILQQEAYAYLPTEAKEYIKEVYEETGEIILTEKNKEENKLYLNPQYIEYLTYTDEEKSELGEIPISMVLDYSVKDIQESTNIPSSYDLRNVNGENYVTPVRDQGRLGICWTFATAGAVESHLLKTNNTPYSSSSKLISERQIDYATSRNGIKDYKSEYVSFINRSLGDGGNFYISTIALANGISLVDYNSFKEYNDQDLGKMELSDVLSYNKSLYEANTTINMPRLSLRDSTDILTDEEKETRNNYLNEVKQNIINNGAAYVGTYMSPSCKYEDSNLNNTVIDVYDCNVTGGHAMEIIGWNDDLEYSYCADTKYHNSDTSNCKRVISGKGVWILKNSWGDMLQYPYLTYDSLYTSIGFIDELTNVKEWDNNYVLGEGNEATNTKTYTLNDLNITNNEKIKKIKFITENTDAKYYVKIKKTDGTYKTYSKTNHLPGLMTIEITDNILVNKNTEITVYSDNSFIDKISVFTSNTNTTPIVDLSKYDNMSTSDESIRLYSETKNIASGTTITYKVYDSNNNDVTNKVSFTNNIVAENNVNTLATFTNELETDTYRIDAMLNSNVIGSTNIEIIKMTGLGTKNNPYIITNSTQLYQIRNDLDAYYELGNDIDLTEDTREGGKLSKQSSVCPQGFGWESINNFSGTLDGKGHTIKGLYQNNFLTCNEEKETWYTWVNTGNGLFGTVKGNATIKNLVLEDFDITCQGSYCGALVSKYIGNMNENGYTNFNDTEEYTATFENIAIKNSKMSGIYNNHNQDSSLVNTHGGGLFGYAESIYGTINISNIYIDIDLNTNEMQRNALLIETIQGDEVNIKNIRLLGDLQGRYEDGTAILIYSINGDRPYYIKNIISTMTATNVMGNLLGHAYNSSTILDGINILNIDNKPLCQNSGCSNVTNLNIYDKETQLQELTKRANYNTWSNFDENWKLETIDGIPRIPVLKFMQFEYTNISNIELNQVLNEKVSIYDYITPNTAAAKRISYRTNNENIVKISEDGTIIPQSTGNTTIHVESLYDGYIKDVPIRVTYIPHYTIYFDSNSGTGEMESIEVPKGTDYILPENKYEKEYYEFIGWNTKADGTGTSYTDLGKISGMNDKETITLYAQWIGEERIVTFDPKGGSVTPESKVVRYGGIYGELPIPTRPGYGFTGWYVKQTSASISVDCNSKLYGYTLNAGWRENSATVIIDANGGKIKSNYDNPDNLDIASDSIATTYLSNNKFYLPDVLYEKEGYRFKEWNTKPDGTGTSYSPGDTFVQSSTNGSDIRIYAIWENATGTITFNSNYGENITSYQSFILNEDTILNKNTFTRASYTFKEWNTKSDGTGDVYTDEQTINISTDLTLYAIWQNGSGTITFNSNYGENITKYQNFTYNQNTKLNKNTFTRTGYIFKEWNTKANGTGTSYSDEQIINKSENITLYAIWQKLVPVYRMYNPYNGEHLYTTDAHEVEVLYTNHGWGKEGIGWYSTETGTPVYRLYNAGLANHLYTSDANEIRVLTTQHGWVQDNNGKPVMYSSGDVPIYRLYNEGLRGLHHLTTDKQEYGVLPLYGWQQENVAMQASQIGIPETTHYYK